MDNPLEERIIRLGVKLKHVVTNTGIGHERLRSLRNGAEPLLKEAIALEALLGPGIYTRGIMTSPKSTTHSPSLGDTTYSGGGSPSPLQVATPA